jgi:hypothetical protein
VVLLAYTPDAAAQVGLAFGWTDAPPAAHSLAFAVLVAPLAATALALALGINRRLALVVSFSMIAVHDLLDMLQTPERQPFWPVSSWSLGSHAPSLIPRSFAPETLMFALAFAVFVTASRRWRARLVGRREHGHPVLTGLLVAPVVLAAVTIHSLRGLRERQLETARDLVVQGRFAEALVEAERAGSWPHIARPGRTDLVRAEALEGIGDWSGAIAGYRRAAEADPSSFWLVSALTAACARSPRAEDGADALRLRERLSREFDGHPRLATTLARIDRSLARRPSRELATALSQRPEPRARQPALR